MKKPTLLFFIFFIFIVPSFSIAIPTDDGRIVPTFNPPLNIFQRMSLFSSIAPNGLTCDDSVDTTITFFAATPTVNVGTYCGSTSNVLLYQTNPYTGLSYVGSAYKISGVLPTFSNLQVGGLYYYFCYNCDNNVDTDCVGLDEGAKFCTKPSGQPWSVYSCIGGKKTLVKTCQSTNDCQNTNQYGWDCVASGTTLSTYSCLSADKQTCTDRQGSADVPACLTGENTYLTPTACASAKQSSICQPYSICLSSTSLFQQTCTNNIPNQVTTNCNLLSKYCDSTSASCLGYDSTSTGNTTTSTSTSTSSLCRNVGQACDGKDYSWTALGHVVTNQCSTGFCWEDSYNTNSGECANPVCCFTGSSKTLRKNTCSGTEVSVGLDQCALPDGVLLSQTSIDAAKTQCANNNGQVVVTNLTTCNPTTLVGCPKKPSLAPDKVSSATTGDLFTSQCFSNSECADSNCVNLQKLVDDKYLTQAEGTATSTKLKIAATGIGLGAVAGVLGCGAILTLGGTVTVLSGGVGAPVSALVATAACAGIGGTLGGIASWWTTEGIDAISKGDLSKTGLCIEPPKTGIASTITNLGHSINNLFGGQAKTGLEDITVGYSFVGLILILIMFVVFKK